MDCWGLHNLWFAKLIINTSSYEKEKELHFWCVPPSLHVKNPWRTNEYICCCSMSKEVNFYSDICTYDV